MQLFTVYLSSSLSLLLSLSFSFSLSVSLFLSVSLCVFLYVHQSLRTYVFSVCMWVCDFLGTRCFVWLSRRWWGSVWTMRRERDEKSKIYYREEKAKVSENIQCSRFFRSRSPRFFVRLTYIRIFDFRFFFVNVSFIFFELRTCILVFHFRSHIMYIYSECTTEQIWTIHIWTNSIEKK